MPEFTGTSKSETLTGSEQSDSIQTRGGSDTVFAGGGNDFVNSLESGFYNVSGPLLIYGGTGNDTIGGSSDSDTIYGEDGDDYIWSRDGGDAVSGGTGDDKILGGSGDDTLDGGEGNDDLTGYEGDDRILGGPGDDLIWGGAGDDILQGGDGNDRLTSSDGNDIVYGGLGDDSLYGREGSNQLYGDGGDDTIYAIGNTLPNTLDGGSGNDTIYGGDGDDVIDGGEGNDSLRGNDGNDIVYGGLGDDSLYGNEGSNKLYGDGGDDYIYASGNTVSNTLDGGSGNDTIYGGDGGDVIDGGGGDDLIFGGAGDDIVDGGLGDDTLAVRGGNNTLLGGSGDDELLGSDGDDILNGGLGADSLQGGGGDDTYYLDDIGDRIFDSGGNDRAIVSVSFAKIPSDIETVEYIDGALEIPYWISALTYELSSGSYFAQLLGPDKTFYYAFPSVIPDYNNSEKDAAGFTALNQTQRSNALLLLNSLSKIIDVQVLPAQTIDAPNTITIALNDQENTGGYAYIPSASSLGSDVFINNLPYNDTFAQNSPGASTITHEIGHALGLKHPFYKSDASGDASEPPYLQGTEDHARWTMMSYQSSNAENKLEFSPLDVAALQYLYGPSTTERVGDDTYTYDINAANFIWDGGGIDTLDASFSTDAVTLFLEPGYWGYSGASKSELITDSGQATINFGSVIENLLGSEHNDTLTGNAADNSIQGNAGDDIIFGGAGDDSFDYTGGEGDDELNGGLGNDSYFIYAWSGNDTIVEKLNEGIDRVYSDISYSLSSVPNVEILSAYNDSAEDLRFEGNELDNVLIPSDGNCVLVGGLGADTVSYLSDWRFDECSIYTIAGMYYVEKGNGAIDKLESIEYIWFSDNRDIDLASFEVEERQASYTISAVRSEYNEGELAQFTISTSGVVAGSTVFYTLSGIAADDIADSVLTGSAVIDARGTALINVNLREDKLTEGTETLTLTLDDVDAKSASVSVQDTSLDSVTVYLTDVDGVPFTGDGRRFVGSDDADMIIGTDDSDQFFGGLGSDTVDGKNGVDTAFFESTAAEVTLKGDLTGGIAVSVGDSMTTLTNVERVIFTDKKFAFDTNGAAGDAIELLYSLSKTAFLNNSSIKGLVINLFDEAANRNDVVEYVMSVLAGGAWSTSDMLSLMATNIYGLNFSQSLSNFAEDLVRANNWSKYDLFWQIAESQTVSNSVDLVGLSTAGIEYS
jgi:Ca2+-binding RTX toxin-like protein